MRFTFQLAHKQCRVEDSYDRWDYSVLILAVYTLGNKFTIRKDAHGHNHNPDLDALCLKTTWFAHPDIDILRALGKS